MKKIKKIFLLFFLSIPNLCFADKMPAQVCHQSNCVTVEVVKSQEDLEKGLMYRAGLGQDRGMLFVFTTEDRQLFWMKNMHFSLDIVWLSADRHIVYIGQNIPACTADPCPVYGPDQKSLYVLEINSGYAASHHWKVGDSLDFKSLPAGRQGI